MALIDNKNQTLQEALKNALQTADSVDIAVGFFYFSGFQALFEQLKDKKIRILVGLEVDPQLIPKIVQQSKEGDIDLSKWQSRDNTNSRTVRKLNYVDAFVGFMNDSDIFDSDQSNEVFDLYIEKLKNGTLEIRKTVSDYHGKFYLVHNKPDASQSGDFPGTMFMGSSNLTYRGLIGQGELNDSSREKSKFTEYQSEFERMWSDSQSIAIADINTKDDFIKTIKPRIWKYAIPDPYDIYIRILHELFHQTEVNSLQTPKVITKGLYNDLEYQIDAIKMVIDKLKKYDGAILADVVGLGKSIISAAVAHNMDMRTVIISPPHLIPQWDDYKEQFGIRGSKVFSSGKINEVYERYKESREPILFVLDEAHRYRNEDTNDYKLLHQVCRGNPDNKVLLLTATPFNNDPKDVFALLKLFQTPGQSTMRSVDNLSLRYRELIQRYKKLRRDMARDLNADEVDKEAKEIAIEQRRLIEPILIRRSRLDLKYITRYREDLAAQGVDFSEVKGPNLLEYDLGDLYDLYIETLGLITKPENQGFIGARYKPTASEYMSEESRKKFIEKYKEEFEDVEDIKIAQSNLAQFMRRLLVMRFESSRDAFRSTLEKMIESNEKIENWWNELGSVPIMKKGQFPDPKDYDLEDGEEGDSLSQDLELLRSKKGFLEIEKSLLNPRFIDDVRHDTELLKSIHRQWYSNSNYADLDPKLDELVSKLNGFLSENPDRKIVIFSSYKDTVDYLHRELQKRGFDRVTRYTAAEGTDTYKKVIKANFDASYPQELQEDDYDVLLATDALSEGFNLHRAGIVINYDIPYNPTRVIQRVGRINRINKKVFDYLYVYNCFPTAVGEEETRLKSISTLKIKLINAVVGSDTRTLTSDEELTSFFKDEFDKAKQQDEQLSWDAPHREAYEKALKTKDMDKIHRLPRRSRIKRSDTGKQGVVVFGKKGSNSIFTYGLDQTEADVVAAESALSYFHAKPEDKGESVGDDFIMAFNTAKEKLFGKHELPKIQGRRAKAIHVLKVIADEMPTTRDYCEDIISIIKTLDDLSDGSLKDISRLDLRNVEKAYQQLLEIVPETYIRNMLTRAGRTEGEEELLLFAEQLV
ncbi:MAG: helicase [Candidatus Portnoybacteria bacterium CG10_big_fil_rev_8_21_14_0_10_36_7]|uniref:Helicase n=1 Tax=Candidatus Portnoybacteria bacterium CG10_big_fil_rev_8_21_14_0_10_36_7 TaxID=1974812 RepID=A0A2M8KD20_9BACT|nr:MAG: helicase [Candidatus Portnoybacteria bacterium CG10_big_fil_rev_8_21_14_0_10_36_7]